MEHDGTRWNRWLRCYVPLESSVLGCRRLPSCCPNPGASCTRTKWKQFNQFRSTIQCTSDKKKIGAQIGAHQLGPTLEKTRCTTYQQIGLLHVHRHLRTHRTTVNGTASNGTATVHGTFVVVPGHGSAAAAGACGDGRGVRERVSFGRAVGEDRDVHRGVDGEDAREWHVLDFTVPGTHRSAGVVAEVPELFQLLKYCNTSVVDEIIHTEVPKLFQLLKYYNTHTEVPELFQ